MGTSMAFYHVKNRGFDREELQRIMTEASFSSAARDAEFDSIRQMFGEEVIQQYLRSMEQLSKAFSFDPSGGNAGGNSGAVIGYRPDAPWLPFFDADICENYNASSRDAELLSKAFGAPVLAFSIFDSDVLMLSYSDAERGVNHNYAKPNCEGVEEYDTELFRAELPAFLLFLCPELTKEKLTEIWEGEEVFADDRMGKLCEVLGMVSLYENKVPEGFEAIKANQA